MSDVLSIESLDLEARGIARRDGKVVFVEGALPGERVTALAVKVVVTATIVIVVIIVASTPPAALVLLSWPHQLLT